VVSGHRTRHPAGASATADNNICYVSSGRSGALFSIPNGIENFERSEKAPDDFLIFLWPSIAHKKELGRVAFPREVNALH